MGKFKIGDKVVLNAPARITGIDKDDAHVVFATGGSFVIPQAALVSVPVAKATGTDAQACSAQDDKPKFKVGDRVRVHDHPYYLEDNEHTGTIISASDARGDWDVKLDNYGGDLSFLESELIPVTLTITAGKHYMTRDGRKVGPMRMWCEEAWHRWEADDEELPYIWADDGTEIDSDIDDDNDIIAEWVGEPANDNGSTAGFTVPLCAYEDDPGRYATELGRAYADGYAAGWRASLTQAA